MNDPASRLIEVLSAIQQGDLTARCGPLPGPMAAVARALDDAIESLCRELGRIGKAAGDLGTATEAVERTVKGLAQNATGQAGAVSEIARHLRALEARSEEVGQIIELLDDVASETNILSLNAAIEASRAGAQGKGFGMVAEEVRRLAERSAAATKDIGAFIQTMERATSEASRSADSVRVMAESMAKTAAQTAQTGGHLGTVAHELWQAFGRFRLPGGQEANLLEALRARRVHIDQALAGLAPLVENPDVARTPVGDAIRRLMVAMDGLDSPSTANARTEPHAG